MKRFINIGNQIYLSGDVKEFSFYCTLEDKYETFCGINIWDNVADFKECYLESGGVELERYLSLITDEFK